VAVDDDTAAPEQPAVTVATRPGLNGGTLRVGNPGNKGRPRSALARQILEASTPQAARILRHIAIKGMTPDKGHVSLPDRLKALTALLDRGGAPVRQEITGSEGGPFVVAVRAALNGD